MNEAIGSIIAIIVLVLIFVIIALAYKRDFSY